MAETVRKFAQSRNVTATRVGDRVVLYHPETREALVLNPTGALVWEFLATQSPPDVLARCLQQRIPSLTYDHALRDVDSSRVRAHALPAQHRARLQRQI